MYRIAVLLLAACALGIARAAPPDAETVAARMDALTDEFRSQHGRPRSRALR